MMPASLNRRRIVVPAFISEEKLEKAQQREEGDTMLAVFKKMANLNERERHILEERRLKDEPTTLEDLSQEYGISRERVRQIEVRAFEKLQKAIRNAAIDEKLVQASR